MEVAAKPGSLLRHRAFVLLWSSQALSLLGSQITYVALPLTAVVVLRATPLEAGLLTSLDTMPFLLFGLFVGVFVDRLARRPILIGADLVRFAALAWVPVSYWLHLLTIVQLCAVVFVVGTMTVFFEVAFLSYVPGLVGRDRLMEANGKLQTSASVAEVAGPGVAGMLISVLSAPVVIVTDALSYVMSALALFRMPADVAPAPVATAAAGSDSVWASVREGFAVIGQNPLLRWCTAAAVAVSLFFSAVLAVYFLFLVREAGIGSTVVGLIVAVGSVGALLGALASERLPHWFGAGPTLVLSLALPGVGYLLLATVHGHSAVAIVTAAAASFIALFGIPVFNVTVISFRQAVTPDHLLGRVNATVRTLTWGTLSLGALLGGVLGSALGLRETVMVAAMGLFVPSLMLFLSPVRGMRRLDYDENPTHDPPERPHALQTDPQGMS